MLLRGFRQLGEEGIIIPVDSFVPGCNRIPLIKFPGLDIEDIIVALGQDPDQEALVLAAGLQILLLGLGRLLLHQVNLEQFFEPPGFFFKRVEFLVA